MYAMIYQKLACMGAMGIDQEGGMFSPNMKNSPQGEVLHIMVGIQRDFWPTKLTESKRDMYPMIYQELA